MATRHNAGAWFVEAIAKQCQAKWQNQKKFHGNLASITINDATCWLLLPLAFMNESGLAVKAISDFYRLPSHTILVVHDELDLPVGTAKLKQEGGHGGHNGLRNIIQQLQTTTFWRLRIGIGHPGHRDDVHDYVLSKPSREQLQLIQATIDNVLTLMPEIITGNLGQVMNKLHT